MPPSILHIQPLERGQLKNIASRTAPMRYLPFPPPFWLFPPCFAPRFSAWALKAADATGMICRGFHGRQDDQNLMMGKVYQAPANSIFEGLDKTSEVVIFLPTVVDGPRRMNFIRSGN